jgi:hypothetical protein
MPLLLVAAETQHVGKCINISVLTSSPTLQHLLILLTINEDYPEKLQELHYTEITVITF